MKLIFKDDKIILYLNKFNMHNVDLNDKKEINKYTKHILKRVQKNYNIVLKGYYTVNMYFDNNYGIIMEIINEEGLYIDYFENNIDINIKLYKDSFLYEVNDINISNNYDTYIYDNHIYVSLKNTFSDTLMTKFIEKVINIKYGIEKKQIFKKLKVLG